MYGGSSVRNILNTFYKTTLFESELRSNEKLLKDMVLDVC